MKTLFGSFAGVTVVSVLTAVVIYGQSTNPFFDRLPPETTGSYAIEVKAGILLNWIDAFVKTTPDYVLLPRTMVNLEPWVPYTANQLRDRLTPSDWQDLVDRGVVQASNPMPRRFYVNYNKQIADLQSDIGSNSWLGLPTTFEAMVRHPMYRTQFDLMTPKDIPGTLQEFVQSEFIRLQGFLTPVERQRLSSWSTVVDTTSSAPLWAEARADKSLIWISPVLLRAIFIQAIADGSSLPIEWRQRYFVESEEERRSKQEVDGAPKRQYFEGEWHPKKSLVLMMPQGRAAEEFKGALARLRAGEVEETFDKVRYGLAFLMLHEMAHVFEFQGTSANRISVCETCCDDAALRIIQRMGNARWTLPFAIEMIKATLSADTAMLWGLRSSETPYEQRKRLEELLMKMRQQAGPYAQ